MWDVVVYFTRDDTFDVSLYDFFDSRFIRPVSFTRTYDSSCSSFFYSTTLFFFRVESNEWMMGTVVWLDGTSPCCRKKCSSVCGSTSKVDDVRTDRDARHLCTYSLTIEFFVLSIVTFPSNLPPNLDTNLHSHTNSFVNIVYVRFFRFLGVIVSSSNACLCYVSAYMDLLPLVSISIRSYVELGSNGWWEL